MRHHACPPSPPSVQLSALFLPPSCNRATYQRPHRAMQSMSVVSPELRVRAFERRVSVGFWLLDTVHECTVSACIFSSIYCLFLVAGCACRGAIEEWCVHTRSCAPSSPDCAGTSSLILLSLSTQPSPPICEYVLAIAAALDSFFGW